ncbi:thiol peroxidase [Alkalicoccus daliensis]|uniref:Thiol peroxidase n=1 Tax=Alkalicoccus daliensis TaxID=745820 RepID=A0A1H0CB94_9BACI|nr:thiol peroxidase [Alkalicoccus daliensis]SDN55150.1 thiol peroxidase (atypical 2-Cys peroxiredoxin) [Alkalicoccus daliensis]
MTQITFKQNPVTLTGEQKQPGDKAPSFTVLGTDLSEVNFEPGNGKKILLSVVPSIDTGTCDKQTRKFNEEVSQVEGAEIWTISADLPFAQRRWCAAADLENAKVFSDHRDLDFGKKFGVVIDEMRLLSRSVFVIDEQGTITYVEYVEEVSEHVNYEKALEALKA